MTTARAELDHTRSEGVVPGDLAEASQGRRDVADLAAEAEMSERTA
jgi:hypothetical protein